MLSLFFGNLDEDLEVVKVKDSRPKELGIYQVMKARDLRLKELGIRQGVVIRIIAKLDSGFIVKVGDSRIFLDINTVKRIYVK